MHTVKALPILILKILEKYSDDNHPITQAKIIEYLLSDYQIEAERKSVSSNLTLLEDLDYDIVRTSKGVYLASRLFDKNQVKYLIDAVFSSKSISANHAKELVERITSLESIYDKKDYEYIYKTKDINRNNSSNVFYNMEMIMEAKKKKKRIEFNLINYDENGKKITKLGGYLYRVSPYFLVNNYGNYYMLGQYRSKYGPLSVYRVDRMINLKVSDWEYTEMSDAGLPKDFSIAKYINEHIYIYGGDVIDAELLILDSNEIINVKEWFSTGATINNVNGEIHASIKTNEQALIYWLMQYGQNIKVLSPESLKEKVVNYLDKMRELYKDGN